MICMVAVKSIKWGNNNTNKKFSHTIVPQHLEYAIIITIHMVLQYLREDELLYVLNVDSELFF